jgi:DNA-binding IclR family transcriptional regulator
VPHATALGKILLAYLDPEAAHKVIQKCGLPRQTRHTITDPAELDRELASIREAGYAVDREEAVLGACCIAAPVRDHKCQVVAAISVSMLAVRLEHLRERDVAAIVRTAAARISAALGYPAGNAGAVQLKPAQGVPGSAVSRLEMAK